MPATLHTSHIKSLPLLHSGKVRDIYDIDDDHMLIVTDPTQRGLVAAQRIAELRTELDIRVENAYLIVNRLSGEMPAALDKAIQQAQRSRLRPAYLA